MASRDIGSSNPKLLAKMVQLSTHPSRVWQAHELGPMLRHQLSAPVQFDLAGINFRLAGKLAGLCAAQGLLIRSIDDLLHHPEPPLELLDLLKRFARANAASPESPFPQEIASLLYFASIAAALVRWRHRLSTLDDAALIAGFQSQIAQPWVDDRTRALFRKALESLASIAGETP